MERVLIIKGQPRVFDSFMSEVSKVFSQLTMNEQRVVNVMTIGEVTVTHDGTANDEEIRARVLLAAIESFGEHFSNIYIER